MTANKIARVSGWLLVSAAVFLTLAPRTFRPQTGVEHHLEHVLAFALLGLAFGLGYPGRRLLLALLGGPWRRCSRSCSRGRQAGMPISATL
jgi:hypothetical protein